jgi:hypothetical protein
MTVSLAGTEFADPQTMVVTPTVMRHLDPATDADDAALYDLSVRGFAEMNVVANTDPDGRQSRAYHDALSGIARDLMPILFNEISRDIESKSLHREVLGDHVRLEVNLLRHWYIVCIARSVRTTTCKYLVMSPDHAFVDLCNHLYELSDMLPRDNLRYSHERLRALVLQLLATSWPGPRGDEYRATLLRCIRWADHPSPDNPRPTTVGYLSRTYYSAAIDTVKARADAWTVFFHTYQPTAVRFATLTYRCVSLRPCV